MSLLDVIEKELSPEDQKQLQDLTPEQEYKIKQATGMKAGPTSLTPEVQQGIEELKVDPIKRSTNTQLVTAGKQHRYETTGSTEGQYEPGEIGQTIQEAAEASPDPVGPGGEADSSDIDSYEGGDPYGLTNASLSDTMGIFGPGALMAGLTRAAGYAANVATGVIPGALLKPGLKYVTRKAGEAISAGAHTTEAERAFEEVDINPHSEEAMAAVSRAKRDELESDMPLDQATGLPTGMQSIESETAMSAKQNVENMGFFGNLMNMMRNPSLAVRQQSAADMKATEARSLGMTVDELNEFNRQMEYGIGGGGEGGTLSNPRSDQSAMAATRSRYGGMGAHSGLNNNDDNDDDDDDDDSGLGEGGGIGWG